MGWMLIGSLSLAGLLVGLVDAIERGLVDGWLIKLDTREDSPHSEGEESRP